MSASLAPLPTPDPSTTPAPAVFPRERLIGRLAITGARVILLRAPAGYGKTELLRAWAASGEPRPFCWTAPGRTARPRPGAGPTVEVRDGWPVAAHGPLERAVDRLSPGSRLVIASRSAVPLGRLRAQHDVLELGPADLALTRREAAAALEAEGVSLDGAPLRALLLQVEGWPAMLSLAAQALWCAVDPRAAALRFGGAAPAVADYLADEVLAPLPPQQRRFLLQTSILEVLDADVCSEILKVPALQDMLHELERGALPVARVDPLTPVLRCHPLLRDALRAELRRREPLLERELHLRASRAFEERGDLAAAIEHAAAGADVERAGTLIWGGAANYAWDGRGATLERWVAALPPRAVERHATVALTAAMVALPDLATARVDRALAQAPVGVAPSSPDLARSLRAGARAAAALTAAGPVADLRAAARLVAADAPDGEPSCALACLLDGAGALLAGDTTDAMVALEDGVRRAGAAAPAIAALCDAELALVGFWAGDEDEGRLRAERARARVADTMLDAHAGLALVAAAAALARALRGRSAEAHADVATAGRLLDGRDAIPPWYQAQVSLALARTLLRLGDAPAARQRLAEARRAATWLPDAHGLFAALDATEAALAALAIAPAEPGGILTPAELRVLHALPTHRSYREIGAGFDVSSNTIKSQAHAVYRKLGVASRSAAVARAVELGLVDVER
ncbi:MAG TPA: LuxR C-terminal-related transcriptional regulator [Baekduia sp.]